MRTFTLEYTSNKQLTDFISDNYISNQSHILIQVFTSQNNKHFILNLRAVILEALPLAKIIGSTTCGEISMSGAKNNSTIISFTIFEYTKIITQLQLLETTSYNMGKEMINSFDNHNEDDLKLIISFADGLNTNGEEYLNGITSVNSDIIVSGGLAGDNGKFEETIVFTETEITNKGSVAAAFYNKDLHINTNYSFNWETVGKKHLVEKSEKNRVYRIGGMTTVEFYKYYLGNDVARMLPALGIEFPLVMKENGISIGRAVLAKHDDGSLSFAGNIPEGCSVQFGHGDVQMIINKGVDNIKNIIEYPVESIFVYSCMARHALLQEDINLEILPMKELAPISGFFTYGEFYHECKSETCTNQLLNQTMTILALSENNRIIDSITPNIFSHNPEEVNDMALHRTQALSILIERTTKELESLNENLEARVQKEVQKNSEKDAMMQMMQAQAQLGDMIEMILHQWRQPLSGISTVASSMHVNHQLELLDDDLLVNNLDKILEYVNHLNITIDDFRDLFKDEAETTKITLSRLIEKSMSILNPLLKIHGITVIKEFDNDGDINVPASLMMQVIINIVKNAIDILEDKAIKDPIIKFKIYSNQDNYIIKIIDNAGGIPEAILPFIFDKKFTTKGKTHGTGIGLDMSKNIIESKTNGKLTAHNVDNCAVFKIEIPKH